jgi:hypothetical protein
MSLPRVSKSTKKDLNDSEADEISNHELKRTMTRVINEIKRTCISTRMNSKRIEVTAG